MGGDEVIRVEICRLSDDRPLRQWVVLPKSAVVAHALGACPELISPAEAADLHALDEVGAAQWAGAALTASVYGQRARTTDPLLDQDRVELLPGLRVDPKVARQRRAEHRRREQGERRWDRDRIPKASA